MLATDESENEGDCEEYIISESQLLWHHDSDQDRNSENSPITQVGCDSSEDEHNVPLDLRNYDDQIFTTGKTVINGQRRLLMLGCRYTSKQYNSSSLRL